MVMSSHPSMNNSKKDKDLNKKRITISISPDIVKHVKKMVDDGYMRSRSDAIEKILREYLSQMKQAVILAGGSPERMYLKEQGTYSPLVQINGRTLIEDTILKCARSGINDIIIIGFKEINTQLFNVMSNGEALGVSIKYVEEKKPLGVAKSIEAARTHLKTDFLMIPGDCYLNFDLLKLHKFHLLHGGIATLAIYSRTDFYYPEHEFWRGIVEMTGANIEVYEEMQEKAKTHLLSTLIGYFSPEIFNYIPAGDIPCSLQEEVFPKLAEEHQLYGFLFRGDWVNVHRQEDVELVRKLVQSNYSE